MNQRQFMVAMFAFLILIVAISLAFDIQPYVMPVFILPGVAGLTFLYQRQQARNAVVPATEPAPELKERVRLACARVGRPGLPVAVVSGGGRAFFAASRGQVLVSPSFGDLVTDAELDALLLQEFVAPPNVARNVWLEILSVPAALLLVSGVLSLWLDLPLYGLGFLLAVVWTVVATQLGWANRRTARRIFQAYLNGGGNPGHFISAILKLYNDGVRFAVTTGAANKLTRAQIAGQMQKHVVLLASMGGISQPELRSIGDAAGAIPELYAPERLPTSRRVLPYSWSIYFGFIVLLVVGSVFLAMLLSRP